MTRKSRKGVAQADATVSGASEHVLMSAGSAIGAEHVRNHVGALRNLWDSRPKVEIFAKRVCNYTPEQRAGFSFELQQELTFNENADLQGRWDVRADMTSMLGRPASAVDVEISENGVIQAEYQMKSYRDPRAAAREFVKEKYSGMGRVVPSDRLDAVRDELTRRSESVSVDREGSLDAQANLADRIDYDGIKSKPITSEELTQIAEDPDGVVKFYWGLINRNVVTQVASASIVAGIAAGTVAATLSLAKQWRTFGCVSREHLGEARKSFRRACIPATLTTAAGQTIHVMAVKAASNAALKGGRRVVAEYLGGTAFGGATLPFAAVGVLFDIGKVTYRLAHHQLDFRAAGAESGKVALREAGVWAGAAIGKKFIPIPYVGMALGAAIGGVVASCVIRRPGSAGSENGRDVEATS